LFSATDCVEFICENSGECWMKDDEPVCQCIPGFTVSYLP